MKKKSLESEILKERRKEMKKFLKAELKQLPYCFLVKLYVLLKIKIGLMIANRRDIAEGKKYIKQFQKILEAEGW